jgi:hypothetical protein
MMEFQSGGRLGAQAAVVAVVVSTQLQVISAHITSARVVPPSRVPRALAEFKKREGSPSCSGLALMLWHALMPWHPLELP